MDSQNVETIQQIPRSVASLELLATLTAIRSALEKTKHDVSFCLKPLQVKCLHEARLGRDVMAVLPTGYGKSLVFQLLPFVLPTKRSRNIVIVVAPLTSIIMDQLEMLPNRNISPKVFQTDEFSEEIKSLFIDQKQTVPSTPHTPLDTNEFLTGDYDLLFAHPEALLSEDGRELLRSSTMQENVVGIVVDEVHCVVQW